MDYSGIKVLIMGLGIHGGGLESARFLLKRGAIITVTDLRDEKTLLPSIERLDAACRDLGREPVHYCLGKHEIEDFKKADIVVKNPGVKPDSHFLKIAKRIETDISLFLIENHAKLFAVTGSKGKSSTASALHCILKKAANSFPARELQGGRAYLGGNITVSPLSFLDELTENDYVVLELSSWQLGDLKGRKAPNTDALLKPDAAVITAIMPDHLDRYVSMEEYVDDKRNIYRGQDISCITVAGNDEWGKSFLSQTKGRPLVYSRSILSKGESGGWIDGDTAAARLYNWEGITDETVCLVPPLQTPGDHQKINCLSAALAAYGYGVKAQEICGALADFTGIEHRLELFHKAGGLRFYNDSAATIPEAAAACIEALSPLGNLVLVTGGTDKNLDFSPFVKVSGRAKKIILLEGSGSEKLAGLLDEAGVKYSGPFDDLEKAVRVCLDSSSEGDIVALSPGCASFGMFLNEFDRGKKWKEAILRLT